MTTTRADLIDTTRTLLEAQGYHATGLSQTFSKKVGRPKGRCTITFPKAKKT